jgi:phosphomannomutase
VSLLKSEELSTLFPEDGSRIGFGTSGLRSTMEPGPLGMNDLVVIQAAHGIAHYCQQQGKKSKVVIGYDEDRNTGKMYRVYWRTDWNNA